MTETPHFEIASNWFKQLEQRDLDQLVSLYSDTQLSFHPTLWNEHIYSRARARDYFVDFLAKRPQLHSYEGEILKLGEQCFLYSGTMKLSLGTERRDTPNVVTARFSFIWTKEADNEWRILHHHNSVVPSS
ncbi:MAG: DUF4440 domain-containing protein [Gammaproteobacteria bacterium]|nr:DUF4440 domain-containing protein [Gammaproteobacteria bacterium]MYF38495.1 DUF4440 domain-containing protein [Gammaproteobacteria bacterium]